MRKRSGRQESERQPADTAWVSDERVRGSLLTLPGFLSPDRHKANFASILFKPVNSPCGLNQLDLSFFHSMEVENTENI